MLKRISCFPPGFRTAGCAKSAKEDTPWWGVDGTERNLDRNLKALMHFRIGYILGKL
jgi:hypothetical protein